MSKFSELGNDLYSGRRGLDFVGRWKTWFAISGVVLLVAIGGFLLHGVNLSLEFRGGSEFRVANVTSLAGYESKAKEAVASAVSSAGNVSVTQIGTDQVRVQTEKMDNKGAEAVTASLAKTFGVSAEKVSSTFVGPSWGQSVTQQALRALIIFFVLVALVLAVYFRTWKMALAAMIAMIHDMIITMGIYALVGFEVSPATMIGFLTVLAYSLYDTVVVFDKVRENTRFAEHSGRQTFSQAANLAVNQTLVRSINTSMVSVLPVTVVLLVGLFLIGPGVLLDLALVLLVGIAVGAYSSVFIASPVLALLREREPAMQDLKKRALRYQESRGGANASGTLNALLEAGHGHETVSGVHPDSVAPATVGAGAASGTRASGSGAGTGGASTGSGRRPLHPSVQQGGPRNQPKRAPKSKR